MTEKTDWGQVLDEAKQAVALAWFERQQTEQKRLDARIARGQLIDANPAYKAADSLVKALEREKPKSMERFEDAKKHLQVLVGKAYADGYSEKKTMLDGLVTAVVSEAAIIHWDEQIALQWGAKVVREHPELIAKLFKPDKAGFKALASENPEALTRLGLLAIPADVMEIKTSYGGRINKGSENRFLEYLPATTTTHTSTIDGVEVAHSSKPAVATSAEEELRARRERSADFWDSLPVPPVADAREIAEQSEHEQVMADLHAKMEEQAQAKVQQTPEELERGAEKLLRTPAQEGALPPRQQEEMFEAGLDLDDAAERHAAAKRIRAQDALRAMGKEPNDDIPF